MVCAVDLEFEQKMKIGILQTGHAPDSLLEAHGDYDRMFRTMLDGENFEFVTYPVVDGVFPQSENDADAWLITGSRHGAYEDHAWIPPLEDLIRAIASRGLPLVGVCFGHQIIAQALGGKVEKYDQGWNVGVQNYARADRPDPQTLLAWHQDQVVEKPPQADVLGSSPSCRFAILKYGPNVLTYQAHPEFDVAFLADLFAARGQSLSPAVKDRMASGAGLRGDLSTPDVVHEIVAVLRQKNPSADH